MYGVLPNKCGGNVFPIPGLSVHINCIGKENLIEVGQVGYFRKRFFALWYMRYLKWIYVTQQSGLSLWIHLWNCISTLKLPLNVQKGWEKIWIWKYVYLYCSKKVFLPNSCSWLWRGKGCLFRTYYLLKLFRMHGTLYLFFGGFIIIFMMNL